MNTIRVSKRQRASAAVGVGAVATAAWIAMLVPAQAQVGDALAAEPTSTDAVADAVVPVVEDAAGTVNETLDTVEQVANDTVAAVTSKLPQLPVEVPRVGLPRVDLPDLSDPEPGSPEGTTEWSPSVATPAPSSPAAKTVRVGDVSAARELRDGSGSDGATGNAPAVTSPTGPGGERLRGQPIGSYTPLPGLDDLTGLDGGSARLPRWLVAAAASLLTVVALGLAVRAMRDEGMGGAFTPAPALA